MLLVSLAVASLSLVVVALDWSFPIVIVVSSTGLTAVTAPKSELFSTSESKLKPEGIFGPLVNIDFNDVVRFSVALKLRERVGLSVRSEDEIC